MPYPPKPPTGQAVGAALKRAGFSRSVTLAGTGRYHFDGRLVRGTEWHSEGYEVKTVAGQIRVRHIPADPVVQPDEASRRRVLMLLRYADALLLAGLRSQLSNDSRWLTVYARKGQ